MGDDLAEAVAVARDIVDAGEVCGHEALMFGHAVWRAHHGWQVFPLAGKVPAIRGGDGLYDATADVEQVVDWWTGPYRGANIGGRVPDGVFVLDADPRKPGHWAAYQALVKGRELRTTLMTLSGRLDGGTHRFYKHPGGKLTTTRLGEGFDIKQSSGYVVLPPSIHPDTGRRYIEIDRPIAEPDDWLINLMRPEPKPLPAKLARPRGPRTATSRFFNASIAADYSENTTWSAILEPHGWRCIKGDGDEDGSVWLHPTHTSACSATVRHGCLFVYSSSTVFETSEPGNPNGYTRFRAYALLNHTGDLSAAARALRAIQLNKETR